MGAKATANGTGPAPQPPASALPSAPTVLLTASERHAVSNLWARRAVLAAAPIVARVWDVTMLARLLRARIIALTEEYDPAEVNGLFTAAGLDVPEAGDDFSASSVGQAVQQLRLLADQIEEKLELFPTDLPDPIGEKGAGAA